MPLKSVLWHSVFIASYVIYFNVDSIKFGKNCDFFFYLLQGNKGVPGVTGVQGSKGLRVSLSLSLSYYVNIK